MFKPVKNVIISCITPRYKKLSSFSTFPYLFQQEIKGSALDQSQILAQTEGIPSYKLSSPFAKEIIQKLGQPVEKVLLQTGFQKYHSAVIHNLDTLIDGYGTEGTIMLLGNRSFVLRLDEMLPKLEQLVKKVGKDKALALFSVSTFVKHYDAMFTKIDLLTKKYGRKNCLSLLATSSFVVRFEQMLPKLDLLIEKKDLETAISLCSASSFVARFDEMMPKFEKLASALDETTAGMLCSNNSFVVRFDELYPFIIGFVSKFGKDEALLSIQRAILDSFPALNLLLTEQPSDNSSASP